MAQITVPSSEPLAWKRSLTGLLLGTMALNVLGLSVPLAASLVFNRVIGNPGSTTLPIIVVCGLIIALAEGVLRLGRASMLTHSHAGFACALTHKVLTHVVSSDLGAERSSSSRSLEQLSAIHQLSERHSGQILVGIVELFFLPLVIGVIFYISFTAGLLVMGSLALIGSVTLAYAVRMKTLVARAQRLDEERYDFLFGTLSALHSIKAMGIEDKITRLYEVVQARVARGNFQLAKTTDRLLNIAPLASQTMVAIMLVFGAVAVGAGEITMGSVTALVLLAGRVMAPLQHGCFIFAQLSDVEAARETVDGVLARPRIALGDHTGLVDNVGHLTLEGVSYGPRARPLVADADLTLEPGEVLAVSGSNEESTALLRLMGGIVAPSEGEVRLNTIAPTRYPQRLLNRCVGYVPPNGALFRGTIRDNITRFGEVSVNEALSVAALLEIDTLIKELPRGLDTPVSGGPGEFLSPGLIKQLAIVRALAPRPKLILLDRAGRSLDKDAYEKLHRFLGMIRGQATLVIATGDENLVGLATKRCRVVDGRLSFLAPLAGRPRIAYRELRL
ncbi:ABC transporter transmembrane domain-containing protein [Acuticoccus sp. I52.16.1]|uniref:ABC transporter transmembrane domain-containing protein n=1 Tax=Acuticoccus sp. I52.16.1 TaxID=2928472 RepID=UPI001FD11857|nr:ABC transporter transmembrane domain-containing protein [Acuticoccus sp. I52.16.1]UOM34107.1 ABC transporter transmembrane domain-containing protein [Acuticoccus sp. I52.16.1]